MKAAGNQRRAWACIGVLSTLAGIAGCYGFAASEAGRTAGLLAAGFSFLTAILVLVVLRNNTNEQGLPIPSGESGTTLSSRLLTIQEEERKNLSRELHDGVGQTITALKMELSRLQPADEENNARRLERAQALAAEALQTIRDVSLLLRPTALDDLGLEAALQGHIENFSRRTSIPARLTCSLRDDRSLPEAVKTCVYRTVQEALNNCEKHACASHVVVEVGQDSRGVVVSIADDGRGVQDRESATSGLGILGMRERAAMLGGRFDFQSEAGKGTKVTLAAPVVLSPVEDKSFRL